MVRLVISEASIIQVSFAASYCILIRRYRPQPWSKPPRDVLSERSDEDEAILMKSARMMTFVAGTAAFSFLMHVLNS